MKKIVLTFAAVAMLFSCQDATEINQPSEFSFDVAYQNVDDVKTGVYAVYSQTNTTAGIQFTSQFTDECGLGEASGNGSDTHRLQLNVNNTFANALFSGYGGAVRNANIFFTGAAGVTPEGADEEALYNEALGEVHALRAYAYTQWMAYFAQDLSDRNSLAVPVFDFIPAVDYAPERNTVQEVYDQILSDLEEAERLLTLSGTPYSVDFVSLDFVRACRARAAAYVGDYATASSNAQAVLNNFSLPSTASESDYRQVWEDVAGAGTANEVVFKFNNTLAVGSSIGQIWNTNSSSVAGSPLYEVSRRLFNILESNEANFGDIRRDVYVDPSSLISPDYDNDPNPRFNDIIVVDKYPGDPSIPGLVGGYTNDQKVFRTAEMHLILAEAAADANNLSEVGNQLKEIRDARYTSQEPAPSFGTSAEALREILNERYIELAFEGHRYIDLKRLGREANQGLDRNETDCSLYPSAECDLPPSDFRLRALPIPAAERRANSNITQNDDY
ncbi:hypothetical protein BST97_08275 [Nonlabens spongiae]|uniref:RagB/SusD family nutrient uptake outer membrane protein n=2 Tax=Nonlabens spongiae TaxID=331648 RepID=A0A1W6MK98_9FLAO|nr:hypothetical protein BST97_08275 [Nonlabens spongiae]